MGVELIKNQKLAVALENAAIDKEVQELLDQARISFYRYHTQGGDSLLMKPVWLTVPLGYHYTPRNAHFFVESLREKIPLGFLERSPKLSRHYPQRYAFFLRSHSKRAKEALETSLELQRFKKEYFLRQICGHEDFLPQIKPAPSVLSQKLARTSEVFAACGISVHKYGWHVQEFAPDCPVAIFRLTHHDGKSFTYFHKPEDEGELVQFILKKKTGVC